MQSPFPRVIILGERRVIRLSPLYSLRLPPPFFGGVLGGPHDTFPSVKRAKRIGEKGGEKPSKAEPCFSRSAFTCKNP